MRTLFISILFLVASLATAIIGTSLSYRTTLTPRASFGELRLVYGDGWFAHGATIQLPRLAARGNRVVLTVEPRPGALPPAHIRALVCGNVAHEFFVTARQEERIFLSGDCEPRTVTLEVLNPFVPSDRDPRLLGAKLRMVTVESRIGPVLVDPTLLLLVTAAALSLSVVAYGATGSIVFCLALLGASLPLFAQSVPLDLNRLAALWFVSISILSGIFIGRRMHSVAGSSVDISPRRWHASEAALVVAILGVGATLRFYQLDFGLPKNFHPDEVPKINAIMRMVDNGDLNPRYFLHPTLLLYCTYAMNTLWHLLGIVEGEFRASAFLAGRTVSALAGTVSVLLTVCIARRLFGRGVGLLSGGLLAVLPLHVTCSRYLKEDVLLLMFILLGTYCLVRAVQERRGWLILLAGLFMGCAMSVKYSGLLGVGLLITAPWLRSGSIRPDKEFLRWTVAALAVMPLAFAACSPYIVGYAERFIKDFLSEKRHMVRGHGFSITAWSQFWMYHVERSLLPGMRFIPLLAALIGMGLLLVRRKIEGYFLIWAVLVFYLPAEWVRAKPAPQPERYVVPCLPFLAIAAAVAAERSVVLLKSFGLRRVGVVAVMWLMVLATPLWRTLELASELGDDTRIRMARWIEANIPEGSTIYLDWLPYNPRLDKSRYHVVYLDRATLLQQLQLQNLRELGEGYLSLSSLFYDRFFSQPRSPAGPRLILRSLFAELPLLHEEHPRFGTYGFHNPTLKFFKLSPAAETIEEK